MNVLVVDHRNVCRSPLAGYLLGRMLPAGTVIDRGVCAKPGAKVDHKVRAWAAKNGFDVGLERHRAVQVTQDDVDWADTVLYMSVPNLLRVGCYAGGARKAVALGEFADSSPFTWKPLTYKEIPDPAFLKPDCELFKATMTMIAGACERFAKSLSAPARVVESVF